MFDNVAFQPHTGNLVILEDGPTSITTPSGTTAARQRSVDLPAGRAGRRHADRWLRPVRVNQGYERGTDRIHLPRVGEAAFVNIQHRAVNDAAGNANHGALVKISGFKVHHDDHDHDQDHDDHGHGHD